MKRDMRLDEQYKKHLIAQESARRTIAEGAIHTPDGIIQLTDEADDLDFIDELERLARRIADVDDPPFKQLSPRIDRQVLTPLGKHVVKVLKTFDPGFPDRHRVHTFHPRIAIMLRACEQWSGHVKLLAPAPGQGLRRGDRAVLLRVVRLVRQGCRSAKFKRAVENAQRLAKKDFQSACAYMTSLFATWSRLLIIRVDLYYSPSGSRWAYSNGAVAGFERFLRALRADRIVPDVCGWLCRREEGMIRGVHFHLLVAIDGHKHRDAHEMAVRLGSYWVENCTGPERFGTYYNCYARRHAYQFNGLGIVDIEDDPKLTGVREAMRYMTKGTYQVKSDTGIARNFRRGIFKQQRQKRGAPRRRQKGMAVVKRILGTG